MMPSMFCSRIKYCTLGLIMYVSMRWYETIKNLNFTVNGSLKTSCAHLIFFVGFTDLTLLNNLRVLYTIIALSVYQV